MSPVEPYTCDMYVCVYEHESMRGLDDGYLACASHAPVKDYTTCIWPGKEDGHTHTHALSALKYLNLASHHIKVQLHTRCRGLGMRKGR